MTDRQTVFRFNATAWRRSTRHLSPLARLLYLEIILKLIELGEHGVIAGPTCEGGLEQLEQLVGAPSDQVMAVWNEVEAMLEKDEDGMYFVTRARQLARDSRAVMEMVGSRNKAAKWLLRNNPRKPYTKTDYGSDNGFRRLWNVTPGELRGAKKEAFREWCRLVNPHGQEFIELVLEKWASYVVSQDVIDGNGQFNTVKAWLTGYGWIEDGVELS